ncbi:PA14 domain-containing protein [Rhizocola hellebori]|nr:PA14 domain-containing protein [Rhizocola hellebori]
MRRTTLVVCAVMLPGLVGVASGPPPAQAAKPVAVARPLLGTSPPVRLPEPSMPTGNAATEQTSQAAKPKRPVPREFDPAREIIRRRDAQTEVYANDDGTETVILHTEPVNFQPRPGAAWEKIDNTLVPDPQRDGWIRNLANSWKVEFGPIMSQGGGVELSAGTGKIWFAPELGDVHQMVLPVIDEDHPNRLVYSDVWPGVDVVYSVTSAQVKESIVVRSGDRSDFPFAVSGLGLEERMLLPPRVTAASAGTWQLGPLEVTGSQGTVTDGSGVKARVETLDGRKDGRQRMTLSVDKAWLATQSGGKHPVVIDPSFLLPSTGAANWACSYLLFESLYEASFCDGIRTGTHHTPGTPWDPANGRYWWRSIARFDYRPYVEGANKDLISAQVWGNEYDELGIGADPELIELWDAIAPNAAGAVANGDRVFNLVDAKVVPSDPWCYWGLEVCWDVTDRIQLWKDIAAWNSPWDDGMFGFGGDEEDPDYLYRLSYKRFLPGDIRLALNVNTRPGKPAQVGPADGALAIDTLEPTLTWQTVDDPDGQEVRYTVKLATSPDAESGMVAQSAELTEPAGAAQMSWAVPAGVLRDGVTYYWKVLAHDIAFDNAGGAYVASDVRKLTVDRKLGMGGLSPTDELGAVTTNMVTGNPTVRIDGPQLPTVGGGVGVGFVYNGRDTRYGLKATYRNDVDKDHVIEPTDPVQLVRTDTVMRFEWGNESPSPGVPTDYFTASWSGSIRLPANHNWQFGIRSDDGIRLRYNGVTVMDLWNSLQPDPVWEAGSHAGGTTRAFALDYYEVTGPAYLHLLVREDLGGSFGPASDVPADWLAPESPALPSGWSLQAADANAAYTAATVNEGSVTLTADDGETFSFARNASGTYTPPPDNDDLVVVNSDGTVAVHDEEGLDYLFRPDGGLSAVRTPLDDRRPAAARNVFDSLGRLAAIEDPVSGRQVTLRYAATDADVNCPNSPPLGGTAYQAEEGMLCRVTYWDGTTTDLFYFRDTDLLSHVANPGDSWWTFSYDSEARMVGMADPNARDVLFSGNRTDTDLNRLFTRIDYDPLTTGLKSRVKTVTLPAAQQIDAARPSRTYDYTQNKSGGILIDGSATVTRGGMAGIFRTQKYDFRGRRTEDTNSLGQTVKTYWDARDLAYATLTPDGQLTATLYDQKRNPVESWGPAPVSMFDKIWYGNDFYLPKDADCMSATASATACEVGRTHTGFDEGVNGLQVKWWNNTSRQGPVVAHAFDPDTLRDNDSGRPQGVNANGTGALYTGDITLPTAGVFKLQICVGQADAAWLFVDGREVVSRWLPDTSLPHSCSDPENKSTWINAAGPGERHSIQIKYADFDFADLLHLNWVRPDGGYEAATGLTPEFNLVTSKIGPDGTKTSTFYSDPANGIGPQHNLVTKTIVDPGGLGLTTTTTYEPADGTNGFLRQVARTLPGGDVTRTTIGYYGADNPATPANEAETRDNPCTPAVEAINQGGMAKLSTDADPDGGGILTPVVREFVYDVSGRILASRVGSEQWTCVIYDARGRATETRYPAFGGQPARTVTTAYAVDPDGAAGPKGPSPLIQAVTDTAGTITSETDLLGQAISYRDVFGNVTTSGYDILGREITQSGPAGVIEKSYDSGDRLTQIKRAGVVQANGLVYNATNGRLESVTYPVNSTKGAFGYDTFGRPSKVTWSKVGGATITSDEVTRNLIGDVVGQVVDGVDHHAGDDFRYDAAGRLYDAYLPGRRVQYEFGTLTTAACGASALPAAGANTHRTKQTVTPTGGAATVTTYCYDRADRLTSTSESGVGTPVYDTHGNAGFIFGETHSYDAADRHMSTSKATTTVSYVRDATDRIVERRVNGAFSARYGSTGSGDTPDFVTGAGNQVEQAYLVLPGGALLTVQQSGSVWSYPNLHGDVVAVAGADGLKQGATTVYDPYGNPIAGTLPDNSQGAMDYGWLGRHQRPLEHENGLQPIVEMGARQYSPLLGQFIEVDPVEGGSANDYDYVGGDPVNSFDLAGDCMFGRRGKDHRRRDRHGHRIGKDRRGCKGGSVAHAVHHVTVRPVRAAAGVAGRNLSWHGLGNMRRSIGGAIQRAAGRCWAKAWRTAVVFAAAAAIGSLVAGPEVGAGILASAPKAVLIGCLYGAFFG